MSNTAHELRNYLTVIDGWARWGLAEKRPPQDCFNKILEASERCENVLRQLFSRARSGSGPMDLNAIVEQLADSLAALPGPTVEVKVQMEPNLPLGPECDSAEMFGALFNLSLNACKAMGSGGKLTLKTFSKPDGDSARVLVSVADTGCGISPDRLLHLWEPRISADGEHGRGLGIVRSTVEQCGGQVSVSSEEGKGTIFTISLPVGGTLGA